MNSNTVAAASTGTLEARRIGDTAVLELHEMGGQHVNGVAIIRVDDTGRIVRVMVRPLQALEAVHQLLGAELATVDGKPRGVS